VGAERIACESCGRHWPADHELSLFEQQALESCPCPYCGAYTLAFHGSAEEATAAVGRPQWAA